MKEKKAKRGRRTLGQLVGNEVLRRCAKCGAKPYFYQRKQYAGTIYSVRCRRVKCANVAAIHFGLDRAKTVWNWTQKHMIANARHEPERVSDRLRADVGTVNQNRKEGK